MTIDVVIPAYKPDVKILKLLETLKKQTVPVRKVFIMNTEEKYFDRLVYGTDFYDRYNSFVEVTNISKREFDHGQTRNKGVLKSDADVVVLMTQDAVCCDDETIGKLVAPLGGNVIASYARQCAWPDATVEEKIARDYNYPAKSCIKSVEDINTLGLKAYYCSNVCAAYNREKFLELGGFVKRTLFNEDMIFAAKAIKKGYSVAYAADSHVYHSHNLTFMQYFHRYFDMGVSQAKHPEVFKSVSSEGEGFEIFKRTLRYLNSKGLYFRAIRFLIQCVFRYSGYFLGKHYRHLPFSLIVSFSGNRDFWEEEKFNL